MDISSADALMEQRRKSAENDLNAEAGKVMLFAVLGLVLGFALIGVVFSILALKRAAQVEREAGFLYMEPPRKVRTARVLAILGLFAAGLTLAIGLASLVSIIMTGIENGSYATSLN